MRRSWLVPVILIAAVPGVHAQDAKVFEPVVVAVGLSNRLAAGMGALRRPPTPPER